MGQREVEDREPQKDEQESEGECSSSVSCSQDSELLRAWAVLYSSLFAEAHTGPSTQMVCNVSARWTGVGGGGWGEGKKKTEMEAGVPSPETTQKHSWGETVSWVFSGFGHKTQDTRVRRAGNHVDAGEQRVSSKVRGWGQGLQ